MSNLGIVTIGRNEGERLRRCLNSLVGRGMPVVYVDGNSTDGSLELARSLGAEALVEDPSAANCVANARNAGFERLCQIDPDVRFVQFIDADCEVIEGWLDRGRRVLEERPDVALVTGRRRERFREQSIYNRLADIEWDIPTGEIKASHGDFLARVEAFRQVGGFDPTVKVSEDHEMCLRLRKAGWILLRLDAEMSLHDMAMTRFGQWWRRSIRTGYGYAQGALIHGGPPERHCVHDVKSCIFWGIVLPLLILGPAYWTHGASLLLGLAYPLQIARIALRYRRAGMPLRDAWLYGWSCTVGRLAHTIGLVGFWFEQLVGRNRRERVITYK